MSCMHKLYQFLPGGDDSDGAIFFFMIGADDISNHFLMECMHCIQISDLIQNRIYQKNEVMIKWFDALHQ